MAQIITLKKPYIRPAVLMTDLDGDGIKEIIAAYKYQKEDCIIVMKKYNYAWCVVSNIKGYSKEYVNELFYKYCLKEAHLRTKARVVNLFPIKIKTSNGLKWGYINNKGDIIIKPKYDDAESFQENGMAVVQEKKLYGLIDENGKYVVLPKYESISQFSEGRAVVIDKNSFKIIDETGRELTTKPYSFIGNFKEGRAVVSSTDREGNALYGYLDKGGKEVIPLKYQSANDFNLRKATVKIKDNQYELIGLDGKTLRTFNYYFVGSIGDGFLPYQQKEGSKFGFIDEAGNVVIEPKFTNAQTFTEGRSIVNVSEDYSNSYGLIDKKGNYILKPQYNDINLLGENRVAVGVAIDKAKPYLGSKYAIADTNGKFLTDFIYNGVLSYKNGFASAYDDKYTFFIDKSGKMARNLPVIDGTGSLSFEGDLIRADVDYRLSYRNKLGNVVWQQNTIIPLNIQYSVKEQKYKPNKDYLVYYPQIQGMKNINTQKDVNNKLRDLSKFKLTGENENIEYSYFGDFAVSFFKKNLLVIELFGYAYPFGAAHGMPNQTYVHIDLNTGKFYELKDLFKKDSNYVKVLSDIIENQIKNNPEYSYVWLDSYKGIKADQPFYVDEDALYIFFYPYDIAPYAAGFPTFKILYKDIMNIIDVDGDFWRAFN